MGVWNDTMDAIQSAMVTASGLPTGNVIWEWQNADAPPLPYMSMGMKTLATIGQDWTKQSVVLPWAASSSYALGDLRINDSGNNTYQCITAGVSAASGGPIGTGSNITDGSVHWEYFSNIAQLKRETRGVREMGLDLEYFSANTADESDAQNMLERVKTALRLHSVRDQLTEVNVSPFDPGPVGYIPEVVAVGFRGRATCLIRCYMPAPVVFEYITYIQKVAGTISYSGGAFPGATTIPWKAP